MTRTDALDLAASVLTQAREDAKSGIHASTKNAPIATLIALSDALIRLADAVQITD